MAKSFFDLRDDIFETLTEASALERRAEREQKQADMAKVAAEQDRKRRRAREARSDYRRDRKRALELESFKVGDTVHLGHGTKGGTGVKGKVHKIDGNTVHIKNDKGDIFKGPRDRVSTAESFEKLTPGQAKHADAHLAGTRKTVAGVRLPASDAQVAAKVKQYQDEKGGNPGNTRRRRKRDLRAKLRDHVELDELKKSTLQSYKAKAKQDKADIARRNQSVRGPLVGRDRRDFRNRAKGVDAATRRLVARQYQPESVELEESNKAKFREILNKGKKLGDWNMMSYFLYDGNVWMLQSGRAVNQGKLEVFMKKAQSGLINSLKFESVQEELGLPNHHPDHHVYKSTEHNLRNGGNPTTRKKVEQYATRNRIRMSPDEAKAINAKGKHGDAFKEQQRRVQQHLKDRHTTKKESFGLEEAHSKDIVKGLTDMDGPFTVVAIKNNKVISQEGTKMRNALPAIVKVMRKKLGRGVTIAIEDRKGTIRNTFKEGVEQVDELKMPKRDASGRIKSDKVRDALRRGAKKAYSAARAADNSAHVKLMRAADTQDKAFHDMDKKGMDKAAKQMDDAEKDMNKSQRAVRRSRARDRKAESVEHLDELSPVKLKKYSQRATRDREDTVRRGYDPMAGRLDPKSEKRRKKRVAGIAKAQRKMATAAEEVEQVLEKKKTFGKKITKLHGKNYPKGTHMCVTHAEHAEWGLGTAIHGEHAAPDENGHVSWYNMMFEHGVERVNVEDVTVLELAEHENHDHHHGEDLNELKSSTLRSYLDKARKQNQTRVTRMADQPDHMPADKDEMHKLRKRRKGSEAAASRLDARKHNLEPRLKRDGSEG